MYKPICSFLVCMPWVNVAGAEIIGVAGGTAAPAATLGPYTMTPFPIDERPLFDVVTAVPSPLGGDLLFSDPASLRRIGSGWGGWPHEYPGAVYVPQGTDEITLTLPPDTFAFYLYVGSDRGASQVFTAQADDGPIVSQTVNFWSAAYFGFYVDDLSENPLETITISGVTFAIGEFGIAVPEPAGAVLLAVGALVLVRRR